MSLPMELLDKFQELIYGQSSLSFSPSRLINLEMQLRERLRTRGLSSYEDYFKVLSDDVDEFDALIEGITTKETHFFRLPDQFRALGTRIIPGIEKRLSSDARKLMSAAGGPGEPLRIWSAGCATGEEPYSIAMTLMSSLAYPRALKSEIVASDISRDAVTTARLGFYESDVIKKIPALYRNKYLRVVSGGGVIAEDLVSRISFRIFNLRGLEDNTSCVFTKLDGSRERLDLSERFDIIFCRNVMIYFDFAAQQRLVDNLFACLRPGGYLFTGDAELLHIYKHGFETLEFEGTYYYRKPEAEKN